MTRKAYDPPPYKKLAQIAADREARVTTMPGFLAEMLEAGHVPSFSPGAAEWMLDTHLPPIEHLIAAFDGAGEEDLTGEAGAEMLNARRLLIRYRDAVKLVLLVSAHHQRAVLDNLHGLLRRSEAQTHGLKPGQEDDLEMLLALLKLGNLGKRHE